MRCCSVTESWQVLPGHLGETEVFADPPKGAFTLLHGRGRYLILGEDPVLEREHLAPGDFAFERRGACPPILPDLLGHATYEHGYTLDSALPSGHPRLDPIPERRFVLHRRLRLFDRHTGRLYEAERGCERELEPRPHGLGAGLFKARCHRRGEDRRTYGEKVELIREAIRRGEVYQVNLSRQETWGVEGDLACFARRLWQANPAPYSSLVAEPDWTLVSSSPECFFRLEGGRILTRPIKGTAGRLKEPAADAAAAAELLASTKNRSELAMIVDLLRNDLSRVCLQPTAPGGSHSGVKVDAYPLLESYPNVHHLVAEVSGALQPGLDLEALMRALFPGGSITGCPKLSAMALIRQLEPCPRRIYTGMIGWLRSDLGQGECAIAIRTAWVHGRELRFGVGGGVVWDSDPDAEFEETVHKGRSLVECLS